MEIYGQKLLLILTINHLIILTIYFYCPLHIVCLSIKKVFRCTSKDCFCGCGGRTWTSDLRVMRAIVIIGKMNKYPYFRECIC